MRYCQYRFDNGWDHVVKFPMVRKMRQARGRLIRSGTDRGVAVILDNRVTQIAGFGAILSNDLVRDCNMFFDGVMSPSDFAVREHISRSQGGPEQQN